MNYWLLLVPVMTGIAGMICVRLPFMLLFHPIRPVSFFGIRFQGIIPATRNNIADEVGAYVAGQVSFDRIENKINDPANFSNISPVIEVHIDDFLRNKLKEQMPMISMFIGDKTIDSLKTVFMKEIADLFPKVIGQFAGNLKADFDLRTLVAAKIREADLVRVAAALDAKIAKPLRALGIAGFVVGLLIGLVQLLLISLL